MATLHLLWRNVMLPHRSIEEEVVWEFRNGFNTFATPQ